MSDQTAGKRRSAGKDGPRSAQAPKPRSRLRTTLKWVLFTLFSLFALGCVGVAIAYATIAPPQPNELANAQSSIVYYDDGKTEMARISDAQGNRESVKLSQVPVNVQHAVLAAEDRDFYTNPGFSPTGIARSVWQAVSGSDVQGGGSTITQQYVKNYFLTSDRSVLRKFKEIIISVKLDQQTSKDQILENYLNTIYYGRGAYGIQTASKAYFGKDVSQLSLSEGAVLASVINAPSLYDPALGTKQQANLASRATYVLEGMQTQGWVTPAERAAVTGPAQTIAPVKAAALSGPTGYVVDAVRKELANALQISADDIDRGGLRITTTINKAAQDAAVAAVQKYLPDPSTNVQAGLTAIKPGDGAIIAMYGGADFQAKQFNSSTDATMQAGSTFKPFAVIGALQQGISTKTLVSGASPYKVPNSTTTIPNEGKVSYGTVDLRTGLAKSINTVYLRLNEKIGPTTTKSAAIAAGIPQSTAGLDDNLVNVLGTASPHVVDVANAYATIAASGVRATPYLIASATSDTVNIDYKAPKQTTRAFSADIAADTLEAMQQVTKSGGTGARASQLGRPVAGKTGTTDGHLSVWWTGVVPQLSVSIGMYRDENGTPAPLDNIPGLNVGEVGGSTLPLSMWLDFMKTATSGMAKQDFPARVGIGDDVVKAVTPTQTATSAPPTTTSTPPPQTTTVTVPPPATTSRTDQPTRTSTPSQTTTSAPPAAPQGRPSTAAP